MFQQNSNHLHIEETAVWLADSAVQALREEAQLTPKPGLVDRRGSGAHTDMNLALMEKSAESLKSTFYRMALAGWMRSPDTILRRQIGAIGRLGEKEMMAATSGVNTHRGAIWSLGLLTTAASIYQGETDSQTLLNTAAKLARIEDSARPVAFSKGQYACHRYKVPGARGEAQMGFPHVMKALPYLRQTQQTGKQAAQINALMAIMAELPDTCVLSRGGMKALEIMNQKSLEVLASGGFQSEAGLQAYNHLESQMMAMNVSPGGAADLLAAAIFIDSITQS